MSEDSYFTYAPSVFPLPATLINSSGEASIISGYMNSTSNPTGIIERSTETKDVLAPVVASFSSRGPNPITFDLLKPDLTAPGGDILAAWSQGTTPSGSPNDPRMEAYNIVSGTSMSCSHASGAAAYVKSFHPTWSPAAIKSALMTTAFPMTSQHNEDAEFSYGSGHINPSKAVDPGLIYDAGEADYVKFLCGQDYNAYQLKLITGDDSSCSTKGAVWDLNYPSFSFYTNSPSETIIRVFHRTVTNVGSPASTYKSTIYLNGQGLRISVEPTTLTISSLGQKQSIVVKAEATLGEADFLSATLQWDDGVHKVNSPIVAYDIDQW